MTIQYCEDCAKNILGRWKGWPHKNAVPLLPKITEVSCSICGGSRDLQSNRIKWLNCHGSGSTGLPDYWLLVIDHGNPTWGHPYHTEGNCPKCGEVSIISEMNYPNGEREYKSNCEICGVKSVRVL